MNFSSVPFLFYYLPLVVALYFIVPTRAYKNGFLLAASLLFYAWGEGVLLLLLMASILANHFFVKKIAHHHGDKVIQKRILVGSLVANLGILVVYKYLGFLSGLLAPLGVPPAEIALPLGISFFTFQAISMNIDVFRGAKAPVTALKTGLYISMFPQLIAGPIVRFNEISDQIDHRSENFDHFASGVQVFIIGLAQKVLLADILSGPADLAFGTPGGELGMMMAWFGLLCFSLQIYYDFAGYSNMAIGLGRMFGFELPQNFNHPYSAASFREFWRRWHMTLSRWFRDYLYIPLGGSRGGELLVYRNLFIVFVLCGLWHGAAWTFLLWGLWHGVFLVAERLCPPLPLKSAVKRGLGMVYMGLFVSLGWVLFRAENLPHALAYWQALAGGGQTVGAAFADVESIAWVAFAAGLVLAWDKPLVLWAYICRRFKAPLMRQMVIPGVVWGGAGLVYSLSLVFIAAQTYKPFLYFRF